MKKAFPILIVFFMVGVSIVAQPTKRAQKKMDLFEYSSAIKSLLKIVENPSCQEKAIPMLAECYRLQRDMTGAKIWYEKACQLKDAKPEWFYYYGKALFALAEYDTARQVFMNYSSMKPTDKRAIANAKQCETLINDWKSRLPGFEIKTLKNINSPQSDFGPAFYANGFTFTSDRGKDYLEDDSYGWTGRKYLKMLFAKPVNTGDFFGEFKTPTLMNSKFNQSFHDGPASFNGDSLAMFTRTFRDNKSKKIGNIKTNFLKIFSTERINGDWQKLEPFFLNSYDYSVGHPALTPDGKTLFLASDMPGGEGGVDLWVCKRSGESWGLPVNLGPAINTSDNEMFPSVRNDGMLFFASDGLPGYGGLDIFSSVYENGSYSTPKNLMAPINSSYDDFALAWITGTNFGLFSSDRPGGIGSDDIYAFRKLPEMIPLMQCKRPLTISGQVLNKSNGKPIEGATVFVLDERTDSVTVLKTDVDGRYSMKLDHISSLIVKATRSNFIPDCLSWPKEKLSEETDNLAPRALLLAQLEINKTFSLDNIYYDFDRSDIRPDAEPSLDKLVRIMKDNPITIELASHTDCRGSFAYNEKLSLRRAESATNYILDKGIDAKRIQSKGYGENQLTNRCADGIPCSAAEHQANRRTEFKVMSFTNQQPTSGSFIPDSYNVGIMISREGLPADFFMQCN
jgi:outer membrane protein OmpA-like peptidoglycan-associated protein